MFPGPSKKLLSHPSTERPHTIICMTSSRTATLGQVFCLIYTGVLDLTLSICLLMTRDDISSAKASKLDGPVPHLSALTLVLEAGQLACGKERHITAMPLPAVISSCARLPDRHSAMSLPLYQQNYER
jgi:hypothetical protein